MIIFLDIDGVLATSKSIKTKRHYGYAFDQKCVEVLNNYIEKTKADVVISSTWRVHGLEGLKGIFKNEGVKCNIIGLTPKFKPIKMYAISCNGSRRGEEIKEWINRNAYTGDYIVIDDEINDIKGLIPDDKIIWIKNGWHERGLLDRHLK